MKPKLGKLLPLPDKLPPSLEARIGKVEFKRGLPTKKSIDQLFDIQDFQRATQLYQWAIPAIGCMGWHRANIVNGMTEETDWVIYDDYVPRQGILTPNTEVSYVIAFPDLQQTGPLVLDYGPGKIAGAVMDYWQRPYFEFGLTGPEKGAKGGKLLVVGPAQKVPAGTAGYHVAQIPTRFAFIGYRVIERVEKDKITPLNKLYPYSRRANPSPPKVIAAKKDFTQSQPRGFAYWEAVDEFVQREPVEERDRFFLAMLRDLGIEKGKPFTPDARQKKVLEDAALLGEEITRVIVSQKRLIGGYYRKDARWQFAKVLDPGQRLENYDQLDERTSWFYEAISSTYSMITTKPGVGSGYLSTYTDHDGEWLDGSKLYRLRIPPDPPMKQFWAVSGFDLDTRNLLRNETLKGELTSNSKGLQQNADGSVDLYFGPTAPPGKQSNWLQTVAGESWYCWFRLFAPTEAYFDRSWPLPDIKKAK